MSASMSAISLTKVPLSQQRRAIFCLALAASVVLYLSFQIQFFGSSHQATASEHKHTILAKQEGDPPVAANFSFIIKLLTYNRLHSLTRCIESLAAADYGAQIVKLHVFIDHFQLSDAAEKLPSSSLIDSKLKEAHKLVNYVDGFIWPHGPKEIHYRAQNAGLQGQWLEAWWPASDHEFAFMVEDDMRLSPLYFKYVKQIIETYYLNPSNHDPTVYGISLQRPRLVPGKHGNRLQVDNSTRLFLYQLVGTWGQLLFPRPWKEFRIWYDTHRSKNLKPLLDGMITTGWYHRSRERIWTPWFIMFVHSRGYFNLYTHFMDEQALSVSYRDKGVNTKKEAGPDSNLIGSQNVAEMNLWEMKPLKHLKRYNYCFHEVMQGRLVKKLHDFYKVVPSLQENGTIILVNTLGFPEAIIRNWLCQFSKFGVRNYMLLLQDHLLEEEFLRRGHAVMHVDLDKDGSHEQSFDNIADGNEMVIKRILLTVQAITWILQAGYNVWVTKVDTLWAANPFPGIRGSDADMLGLASGMGTSTGLLYTRSSKGTLLLWRSVHDDVLHQAESLTRSRISEAKQDFLEVSLGHMLSKSTIKFKLLSHTLMTNFLTLYKNQTDGPQLPAASLITGIQSSDACISVLKSFGLWMLDDELACTGVFC